MSDRFPAIRKLADEAPAIGRLFRKSASAPFTLAALHHDDAFTAANDAINRLIDDPSKPRRGLRDVAQEFAERLRDGEALDSDAIRLACEALAAERASADLEQELRIFVSAHLRDARDVAIRAVTPSIVQAIDLQVRELVESLRSTDVTVADADPSIAIDTGREKQHRAIREAVDEHESLITELRLLHGLEGHEPAGAARSVVPELALRISNPSELTRFIGAKLAGLPINNVKTGESVSPVLPWPDPLKSPLRFMGWLACTPDAKVWAPTGRELLDMIHALNAEQRSARDAARSRHRIVLKEHADFGEYGDPFRRRFRVFQTVQAQADDDGWLVSGMPEVARIVRDSPR